MNDRQSCIGVEGSVSILSVSTPGLRVLADILRKYPRCASKVVPKIAELFKNIDKASGKVITAVHSWPRFVVARARNRAQEHARSVMYAGGCHLDDR